MQDLSVHNRHVTRGWSLGTITLMYGEFVTQTTSCHHDILFHLSSITPPLLSDLSPTFPNPAFMLNARFKRFWGEITPQHDATAIFQFQIFCQQGSASCLMSFSIRMTQKKFSGCRTEINYQQATQVGTQSWDWLWHQFQQATRPKVVQPVMFYDAGKFGQKKIYTTFPQWICA